MSEGSVEPTLEEADSGAERGAGESPDPLVRLAGLAHELDAGDVESDAAALADRVREGRFFVACIGEFKRGKSTLINALVGHAVLPTGIVPVTAVPTVLRYGTRRGARVRHAGGGWSEIAIDTLADWVSEERNPGNRRQVVAIEVFLPAAVLEHGVSLVDTPGLGSVFAGASERARSFVPHIDVAVLVTGVDPPISGDELALLESLAPDVADVLVVVNKVDRHPEGDITRAVSFTERIVADRLRSHARERHVRFFRVSATNALRAEGRPFDWGSLTTELRTVAESDGRALSRAAASRGVQRLRDRLVGEVTVRCDSLTRPIAESARRVDALRETTRDVAHRRVVLGYLLAAEEAAMHRSLESWRDRFTSESAADVTAEFDRAFATADRRLHGPARRRHAMDLARSIARARLAPWLAQVSTDGEALYRDIVARHVVAANAYLDTLLRVNDEASPGTGRAGALDVDAGFRVRSGFYHTDMMTVGSPVAPGTWLLDVAAPRAVTTRRIRRDAIAYLRRLLDVNTSRVLGDIRDRVLESRRGLEAEVERFLRRTQEQAERGLESARATRAQGERAIQEELARLDRVARALATLTGDTEPNR